MTTPIVSVVVPAYNEAKRIRPTLERIKSYFGERNKPFEILVVDDGSTDDTIAVARGVGDPVRVIEQGAQSRKRGGRPLRCARESRIGDSLHRR